MAQPVAPIALEATPSHLAAAQRHAEIVRLLHRTNRRFHNAVGSVAFPVLISVGLEIADGSLQN